MWEAFWYDPELPAGRHGAPAGHDPRAGGTAQRVQVLPGAGPGGDLRVRPQTQTRRNGANL